MLSLITGGARSGKSRRALELTQGFAKVAFLATSERLDAEMNQRIERHQAERGERFVTLEEPLDLARALEQIPNACEAVLVDCLTLWANNLIYHLGEREDYAQIDRFFAALEDCPLPVILVTNEVGWGIVPADPQSRFFRDLAGRINQRAAAQADHAELVVSGLPLVLKTNRP